MTIIVALICLPATLLYRALDWIYGGNLPAPKTWSIALMSLAMYGAATWAIWFR